MEEDTIIILAFMLMLLVAVFGFVFLICFEEVIEYKRRIQEQNRKERKIIKGEKDGE